MIPDEITIGMVEIPGEITLCIPLAECSHACKGCHSVHYQRKTEFIFNSSIFAEMLTRYKNKISCVVFMGDGRDNSHWETLCAIIKAHGLKSAIYTGNSELPEYSSLFDYIKYGPYIEALGPLTSTTTNQKLINMVTGEDITYKFWRDM